MRPFDVAASGTPPQVWAEWLAARPLPLLDVTLQSRLVVVAPHPDDETLGAGGLMAAARARGTGVTVVAVTDGEAADPGADSGQRAELAHRRRGEQRSAVARLGIPDHCLVSLGLADGGLTACELEMARLLEAFFDDRTTVAVTWEGDGHPDHEAAARAARRAAGQRGSAILRYPIWAWHWDSPARSEMPWDEGRAYPLDHHQQAVKQSGVKAYSSQTGTYNGRAPVLPPHVLRRLLGPREVFFEAGA